MDFVEYKGKKYKVKRKSLRIVVLNEEIVISKIEGLDKLTDLKVLELRFSYIKKIDGLENLSSLKKLRFDDNEISKIEGLDKLTNLSHLVLDNNKISKIEGLDKLINLNYLNLSNNKISKIEGLDDLTNLQILNLSHNKIVKIDNLDNLRNLQKLYFTSNQIINIEGLDNLKKLQHLNLINNQIYKIEGLDALINLKYLYLDKNKVKNIEGFDKLSNLNKLKLQKNPINKEEHYLIDKSAQEVVKYCKEKKRKFFIFMLMPFKPRKLTEIYERYIKEPLKKRNFIVKRADDFFKSRPILQDILESITRADIIIADLTNRNPNVFFEIGIARERGKYVIQICQAKEDIPFDLRQIRTIIYKDSPEGYENLKNQILKYIDTYIKENK